MSTIAVECVGALISDRRCFSTADLSSSIGIPSVASISSVVRDCSLVRSFVNFEFPGFDIAGASQGKKLNTSRCFYCCSLRPTCLGLMKSLIFQASDVWGDFQRWPFGACIPKAHDLLD